MTAFGGRSKRLLSTTLIGAVAILLLGLAPGALPPALGQTAGPPPAITPFSSLPSEPFPPPSQPLQTCPGGQIIPLGPSCQALAGGAILIAPGQVPGPGFAAPANVPLIASPSSIGLSPTRSVANQSGTQVSTPSQNLQNAGATGPEPLQGEENTELVSAPEAAAPLPAATYSSSTSVDVDASQSVSVDALVDLTDPSSGAAAAVVAASVNLPEGAACDGSGPVSISLTASNTTQPLNAALAGSCADGSSMTLNQPATVCVAVTIDVASSGIPTLSDSAGDPLAAGSFDGVLACGDTMSVGTYTVAVAPVDSNS